MRYVVEKRLNLLIMSLLLLRYKLRLFFQQLGENCRLRKPCQKDVLCRDTCYCPGYECYPCPKGTIGLRCPKGKYKYSYPGKSNKFTRLMHCGIKSVRPIFKIKTLVLQYKANIDMKTLFGKTSGLWLHRPNNIQQLHVKHYGPLKCGMEGVQQQIENAKSIGQWGI